MKTVYADYQACKNPVECSELRLQPDAASLSFSRAQKGRRSIGDVPALQCPLVMDYDC